MRGGSWLGPWLIVAACLALLYALLKDPRGFVIWWRNARTITSYAAEWLRYRAWPWIVARPRSIRLVIARRHVRERTS